MQILSLLVLFGFLQAHCLFQLSLSCYSATRLCARLTIKVSELISQRFCCILASLLVLQSTTKKLAVSVPSVVSWKHPAVPSWSITESSRAKLLNIASPLWLFFLWRGLHLSFHPLLPGCLWLCYPFFRICQVFNLLLLGPSFTKPPRQLPECLSTSHASTVQPRVILVPSTTSVPVALKHPPLINVNHFSVVRSPILLI